MISNPSSTVHPAVKLAEVVTAREVETFRMTHHHSYPLATCGDCGKRGYRRHAELVIPAASVLALTGRVAERVGYYRDMIKLENGATQ